MSTTERSLADLRTAGLAEIDPEIAALCNAELQRQRDQLELIASENFTWPSVLEAVGSVLTNKYAEGLPGQALLRRLRGRRRGREPRHRARQVALRGRARERPAALAAPPRTWPPTTRCSSRATPSSACGSTTAGTSRTACASTSRAATTTSCGYGVRREDERIDMDEVRAARARAPAQADRRRRLGLPARDRRARVPRDRRRGRRAADGRHGPLLGPRRGGAAPEPGRVRRHRHLDDPQDARRAALGLRALPRRARHEGRPGRLPRACRAGRSATSPRPRPSASRSPRRRPSAEYQGSVLTNARALAEGIEAGGARVLTGGTDTHLVLLDLRGTEINGPRGGGPARTRSRITANRNTVPFDERPPTVALGRALRHPGGHHARPRRGGLRARSARSSPTPSRPTPDLPSLAARISAILATPPAVPGHAARLPGVDVA